MLFSVEEGRNTSSLKNACLGGWLYKGQDLTSSLVGVLLRFREERVPVMSDIESTCSTKWEFQILTVPFCVFFGGRMAIWRANCKNIRWLFTCSGPFDHRLAQNLALRKTAEDNHHSFQPNVINTVKRNFFVDDCLNSLPAEQKAVEHVGSLCTLLSRGGFKLAR